MKIISSFLTIAFLAIFSIQGTPAQEVASERAAVEKALVAFFDAAKAKNWAELELMLASDFEFYSDAATVVGRAAFIDAMKDDSMEFEQINLKGLSISVSGNLAWVKYTAHLESMVKGRPYNMNSVETVVFRKEGDTWKMVHNHASIKELS